MSISSRFVPGRIQAASKTIRWLKQRLINAIIAFLRQATLTLTIKVENKTWLCKFCYYKSYQREMLLIDDIVALKRLKTTQATHSQLMDMPRWVANRFTQ